MTMSKVAWSASSDPHAVPHLRHPAITTPMKPPHRTYLHVF